MFIPVEVAAADPASLAPFWPRALLPDLRLLTGDRAVLGATSAALRHLGAGGALTFSLAPSALSPVRVHVSAVVPDAAVGAAEVFVSPRLAATLGVLRPRYLLVDPARGVSARVVERRIRDAAPAGVPLQLRVRGETPFLRQGDAVLAPAMVKKLFGEFASTLPTLAGWFTAQSDWVQRHIVMARVPILGHVRCNHLIIRQLRAALVEIRARGLAKLIDAGDYGGCFAPRLITGGDRVSGPGHHAWGIAIDINVSRNPFGGRPTQDPRIVAIFRRWGFTWGGRWIVPDGMHFEATRIVPAPGG
jgi:hypothetical protein